MFVETVVAGILTYLLMLSAFYLHRIRSFHVPVMIFIVLFDLLMPVYLYSTRDWKTRLIDDGDIFSFAVWMHFGLLIALFVLYAIQIMAGRKLLQGDQSGRGEHKNVAKGILAVRALVILTGALLVQPQKQ
ncbi:MAG: hypothetical protein AMJ53_13905 [Gammaproteobacteria bacterium SG8_11]|nr:MAG: hypothetical protein AMJ53_13905 [Gammaproteobacteria bacterium SG8_11]